MADQKISQLTSATLPLAGTEVLPIVQGGATVKVATGELVVFPQGFAGIKYKSNNTTFNSGNVAVIVADTLGSGNGNLRVETYGGGGGGGTTMEFQGSGDVAVSRGNLVIGTSGKGIDFSATPGTGTSELLADYEEGTWTPVIAGQGSAGVGTYTSQVGRYTKVGRAVHFTAFVDWSAHTGTGTMVLNGLPFTSDSTAGVFFSFTPFNVNLTYTTNYQVALVLFNNSTTLTFYEMNNNIPANQLNIDTSAIIVVSGTYFV
jgi:hypothetical protein